MFGIKRLTTKRFDIAVENAAKYYCASEYYQKLYNNDYSSILYNQYIEDVSPDLRVIMENGNSYLYKNEYLFCIDVTEFMEEHDDVMRHYLDYVYDVFMSLIKREKNDVLYIPAAGPSRDFFTQDMYKLINAVVNMYPEYTIISDCPIRRDFEDFEKCTYGRPITTSGVLYFRWAKRGD